MKKLVSAATVVICIFGLSLVALGASAVKCRILATREDKVNLKCLKGGPGIRMGDTVMVRRAADRVKKGGDEEGC